MGGKAWHWRVRAAASNSARLQETEASPIALFLAGSILCLRPIPTGPKIEEMSQECKCLELFTIAGKIQSERFFDVVLPQSWTSTSFARSFRSFLRLSTPLKGTLSVIASFLFPCPLCGFNSLLVHFAGCSLTCPLPHYTPRVSFSQARGVLIIRRRRRCRDPQTAAARFSLGPQCAQESGHVSRVSST